MALLKNCRFSKYGISSLWTTTFIPPVVPSLSAAVIITLPTPFAVTSPFSSTAAIDSSALDQLATLLLSET